jgi:hypothetical protein
VDRLALLQEAIDHTSAVAELLHCGEQSFILPHANLFPGDGPHAWMSAHMQRIILQIAEDHVDECDLDPCRTCMGVWMGVTLSLNRLTRMRDEEMEQRFNADAEQS